MYASACSHISMMATMLMTMIALRPRNIMMLLAMMMEYRIYYFGRACCLGPHAGGCHKTKLGQAPEWNPQALNSKMIKLPLRFANPKSEHQTPNKKQNKDSCNFRS